jgi:hypothetical protein
LTLPEVIAAVVAHFKSKKVSTFVETDVSALIIKGFVVAFPLLQHLGLLVEAAVIEPST